MLNRSKILANGLSKFNPSDLLVPSLFVVHAVGSRLDRLVHRGAHFEYNGAHKAEKAANVQRWTKIALMHKARPSGYMELRRRFGKVYTEGSEIFTSVSIIFSADEAGSDCDSFGRMDRES
eukprot:4373217-Amphidinium_carterae.1